MRFAWQAATMAPESLGELIGFSGALDNVARVVSPLIGSFVLASYGTGALGVVGGLVTLYSTLPLAAAYRAKARRGTAKDKKA